MAAHARARAGAAILAIALALSLGSSALSCAAQSGTAFGSDDGDDAGVTTGDATADSSRGDARVVVADADPFGVDSASDALGEAAPPPPGSCVGKKDGDVCVVAPDPCHSDATCSGGLCGGLGTRPDGYNWKAGDDNARCCNGAPLETTSDANCGACGISCNAANGESCSPLGGHYFCRGCIASAQCWSKCCSTSFTPYSCAASDCAGSCDSAYCPKGTHCVVGAPNSSDYCAY